MQNIDKQFILSLFSRDISVNFAHLFVILNNSLFQDHKNIPFEHNNDFKECKIRNFCINNFLKFPSWICEIKNDLEHHKREFLKVFQEETNDYKIQNWFKNLMIFSKEEEYTAGVCVLIILNKELMREIDSILKS